MLKIIWSPAITLDGYIAKLDGNSDWVSDEDGKLFQNLIRKTGCVIVGHKTYEQYKGQVFPVAGATTYVWTQKPESQEQEEGVKYVSGSPAEVAKTLENSGYRQAVLAGGGETNDAFVSSGLVSEIIATIYPLVFGEGIRMLSKHADLKLELLETINLGDGTIRQRYLVK